MLQTHCDGRSRLHTYLSGLFRNEQYAESGAFKRRLRFEQLEERYLLTTTPGIWQFQGPAPIRNGQTSVPPNNLVSGAVESIAVNPDNPSQIYVGTVNGGVWRTDNANPNSPDATVWTPLTDQLASLAMGDIAFSPLDPSGNTLFAGTGSYSSLGAAGGPAIGVLRTTDGGANWSTFSLPGFQHQIKTVLPTTIDLDPGSGLQQMVLVSTIGGGGLYRSNDNGQTYTLLSGTGGLPNGDVYQLIADPNNGSRFYASIGYQGIFRGDFDSGSGNINWVAVNDGITGISTAGNIQVAAVDSGANTTLFALLSGTNYGAFRSVDNGASWTTLATPPSNFNLNHALTQGSSTMLADPTNDQVVYIAAPYNGEPDIFRYDPAGAGSWVPIDYSGAQANTAPHADARDLAFQGTDTLIASDDGGIYFIQHPLDASNNSWHAYIGDGGTGLGNIEFHDVAWDAISNVIVGGAQDNGTEVQQSTGSKVWNLFSYGDGGDVTIDPSTLASANESIRYFSYQELGGFSRQVVDAANNNVGGSVSLIPSGGLPGFVGQFITPVEINAIDPPSGKSRRIVIGGRTDASNPAGAVYEADNAGIAASADDVNWVRIPTAPGFAAVSDMAYGGRSGGVDNPDVLYVGSSSNVFVRTTAGGTLIPTATPFPGGFVRDIVLDPDDWHHVFVITYSGVWEGTDTGSTWTSITGDLSNIGTTDFLSMEYISAAVDALVVGTNLGVYATLSTSFGTWLKLGNALPNAEVWDLDYDAADNILVAGTLGRGAWSLNNVTSEFSPPGASIQGQKWNDLNNNGVEDSGEPGLQGWTIYLDADGDGQRVTAGNVEPDAYDVGTLINNINPAVTLSAVGGSSSDVYTGIPSGGYASTGTTAFTRNGPFGWGSGVRLRADFATPVNFVSIDAISDDALDVGLLEAYDADGNLLASYTTGNLAAGDSETMSISRPTSDISYVVARGAGAEILNLDNLQFVHTDLSTTTDQNGNYSFFGLATGSYLVREEQQANWVETAPGLATMLNQLNADSANIAMLVPNRFDFTDGDTGNSISDGGNDMYDGGNFLNTNLASNVNYTNGTIVSGNAAFGAGSKYFTAKFPGLFVLGATNISINSFQITGNNGADGSGNANGGILHTTVYGQQYTIFFKRVYNAGDPSINHIIMVAGDGSGLTHNFSTDTNNDLDSLTGLSSVDEIYYALVARQNGGFLADADVLNIANEFLANVTPSGAHFVSLNTDEILTGLDFGNHALPGAVYGRKWNDANGNGIQDEGEPALAGWTVYLDDNDNGTFDVAIQTPASTDVPLLITDYTTTTSSLLVNGLSSIQDVNVTLDITHTYDADLVVSLISPLGTRVNLFTSVGSDGDNFQNTTLDDEAATSITSGVAPFTGSFRPQELLSALDGEDPNGLWQLEVKDVAGGDIGTLNSWSLTITSSERSTTTDANGNYALTNLAPGNYIVREVQQPGWWQTTPIGLEYGAEGTPFAFEDISATGSVGIAPLRTIFTSR